MKLYHQKRKQKSSWRNIPNQHRLNVLIMMDLVNHSLYMTPHPSLRDEGINDTKIKGSCQEIAKENFIPGKQEVNWNQKPLHQHKSEMKNTRPCKFKRLPKSSPSCKNTFQGDPRNSSSSRKVKIFFEKLWKSYKRFNISKHSQGLFYRLCRNSLLTKKTKKGKINQAQEELVSQEVKKMLKKDAIREAINCQDQFFRRLFLVLKKDGRQRPVIKLKDLNTFIPYKYFKIEGLHLLKEILEQDDYLCKLDCKDVRFCVPLNKQSRKYLHFE